MVKVINTYERFQGKIMRKQKRVQMDMKGLHESNHMLIAGIDTLTGGMRKIKQVNRRQIRDGIHDADKDEDDDEQDEPIAQSATGYEPLGLAPSEAINETCVLSRRGARGCTTTLICSGLKTL